MALSLAPHAAIRQAPQFWIYQLDQLIESGRLSIAPSLEQFGNVAT
jgi:hypothetical protein